MTVTYYLISIAVAYGVYRCAYKYVTDWFRKPNGSLDVPSVSGCWPIVGHALAFGKDPPKFIRETRKKYGDVFRIKLFNLNMMVVCDRSMTDEYFKKTESKMSLYKVLDRLYFSDAFSDDPANLESIITLVKTTISIKFDVFAPKIMEEANKMNERLKHAVQENGGKCTIKLTDEMTKFVANTSAKCFISYEMDSQFYEALIKFTHLLNRIVVMTSFVPKFMLRLIFNPTLRKYRREMTQTLAPEIETYREDPDKNDSLVFRKCVDYINPKTGRHMTNDEIGDVIVCLLYVSSENTALGLSAALLDMSRNPTWWENVKNASRAYMNGNDYKALFADQTVDACLMESARMNTHIFALQRKPMVPGTVLGKWYVASDIDSVTLCQPLLMVYEKAHDVFTDPERYNPDRFITHNEPQDSKSIMTWGSGVHLCPGKMFAIYETKAAMALLTNTFEQFEILQSKKDYFSPSAYAETAAEVTLVLRKDTDTDTNTGPCESGSACGFSSPTQTDMTTIFIHGDIRVTRIVADDENNAGWLIRNYISLTQQQEWYQYTQQLSSGTPEHMALIAGDPDPTRPVPLTYYKLVYTGGSNCAEPVRWFNWAQHLWKMFHDYADVLQFPRDLYNDQYFNSIYSQMYHVRSTMRPHKDEYVDWGVSVSLGASCDFTFGRHRLVLNSGDVFVADFSRITHSIDRVHNNTTPSWFNDDNPGVQTFDRARCSIQLRSVTLKSPEKAVDMSEFREMINKS